MTSDDKPAFIAGEQRVSILAHIHALRDADDKRYQQKFEALEKAFNDQLLAQEKAVDTAMNAAEKAVNVAETTAEKWRANANEWRKAMDDRERNFLPRAMGYVIGAVSVVSLMIQILSRLN